MNDSEIYDLAANVLLSITTDLSNDEYAELGGSIQFSWSTEKRVSAWAESTGDLSNPPQHRVVICYELARQLYRDTEDYHEFAGSELLESPYKDAFHDADPKPWLPNHIDKVDSITNMFIGAITWVFFHEIGHLMQEHGYIRTIFGEKGEPITRIEDSESNGKQKLEGRTAVISHVTEFAADVEATQWCVQELVRQILSTENNTDEQSLKEFQGNLHLLVCGISCALYRFYGERPVEPEQFPEGSHPTPIRRLEICLPNIYEKLDLVFGQEFYGLSRSQLVNLSAGAAYCAGFFWLWRYSEQPGIPDNYMTKGLLQDPYITSYWREILRVWDELEPEIKRIRRFGNDLGILSFTAKFRSEILVDPVTLVR